jgi:RHS repeat-associated protein
MSRQGRSLPPARWSRWSRRTGLASAVTIAALALQVASETSVGFTSPVALAVSSVPSGHPNRFNPTLGATSATRAAPKPATTGKAVTALPPAYQIPSGPMQPAEIALTPAGGVLLGSDGVLEVDVPVGAVTASDVTAAGGGLSLLVRQVLPGSGGSAGGSGRFTLGAYLLQVLDAKRQLWSRTLHASLGIQLHAGARTGALDLSQTVVVLNQTLPPWFDSTPPATPPPTPASGARQVTPVSGARTAPTPKTSQPALGKRATIRASVRTGAAGPTLSALVSMSGSSMSMTFGGEVPVATFGKPDPFEAGLSSGSLAAGYPLDLPAGPGGLTPQLVLSYSSAAVNDQHNVQAAAPWVGEGWSLTMGAISWAEHNVAPPANCNPSQTTCPSWDDTWQLSDAYGTSAELIPPNMQVSTYYDDTTYPMAGSPVTWHTAPETHAKVISYTPPTSPSGLSPTPPCFRVFLPSGIMEEFGCTPDSLQWYPQQSGGNGGKSYIANWLLDLITDPQGNQVHVTYQQDVATAPDNIQYTRDSELATVEYDSPACHNAQTACTGSSWAPQMRAQFLAGHWVNHVLGSSCAPSGSLRCDDPADLSGSNGVGVPLIQNTFVLNDVLVQTRASGSADWNTLRDYQFSYDQSGPTTIPADPFSGQQESTAGKFDLTQLKTIGGDAATALPATAFTYTSLTQYYEDSMGHPTPSTNCGPSWNTSCALWSQSYAGNSMYLSTVSNGLGLAESLVWADARSNSSLGNQTDPLFCDNPSNQNTSPCARPDDGTWSRIVLASKSDAVQRISQAGQGGQQTTTPVTGTTAYTYRLAPWVAGCSGCQGMYWRSSPDSDQAEFYNGRFMGFAQATVAKPDNSIEIHHFLAGEGQGVYDAGQVSCSVHCGSLPWWDLANAAHMHETEVDSYDTNGTTLLSQVKTVWRAVCPPPGVGGSPTKPGYGTQDGMLVSELDQGTNPVAVCDVQKVQSDTLTYDGTGGVPVHSAISYSYDSYGRVSHETRLANAAAADSSGHGSHATLVGEVTQPVAGLVGGDADTATSFDGSTAYALLPSAPFGSYPTSGSTTAYTLTFEAWFETTTGGVILGQTNAGAVPPSTPSGWVPSVYVDSTGALHENLFWPNRQNFAGGPYNDGRPHYVVAVYNAGTDSLYVDGQLIGSASASEGGYSPGYTYFLGTGYTAQWGGGNGGWYPFKGTIGKVAVYPTALSAARIQAHFTAGSNYQAAVAADSPAAYWRMNEQAGTTSPSAIVDQPAYVQNDNVTAASTSATGQYLVDYPAFSDTEDTGGNRYQCTFSQYDGMTSWVSGQQPALTIGNLTKSTRNTGCGTAANHFSDVTGPIMTTSVYDVFGNLVASSDPDANVGVGGHTGCTVGSTAYSACTTIDSTFGVLPTSSTNALNQTTITGYQTPYQPPSTIADSSGNGHSGNWSGAVGFGAPGLVSGNSDTAMSFGGAGYVTSSTLTPLQGDNSRSVEMWFQTTAPGPQYLFSSGLSGLNAQNARDFGITLTSQGFVNGNPPVNTPGIYLGLFFDDVYLPGLNLADGHPHHVVATLSGTTVWFYVDGNTPSGFVTSGTGWSGLTAQPFTLPITPNTAGNPVLIGQSNGSAFTRGAIGEVAVYPTVLSATRVQAHFTAGSGYQAAVAADSPTAYWRLNDGSPNPGPATGYGLWPTSQTDASGQTTSIGYDALGREVSRTLPGETSGLTTAGTTYTVWCSGALAQTPCVEVDKTQRVNSTTTATSRAFYDGLGHLVETRSPAAGGQDVVSFSAYDSSQRLNQQSVPYLVTAYTGAPGAAAYSIPDSTQAVTTYTYDGLGRVKSVTDPLSHQSSKSYAVGCAQAGTSDTGCYEQTLSVDANGHQGGTLVDGLGRTAYVQRYTGSSSSNYALYATARYTYDFAGDLVKILQPDGSTQSTFGYDMAGRKTSLTDPDLGAQSYSYDQDGNLTQSVDARGSAGTIFMGYDGLNRPIWRNTTNSPTGAYDTYGYDSTAGGSSGVGRLTGETFATGSLSGSYSYLYDGRGQQTQSTLTVGTPSAPAFVQQVSNHAAGVTSLAATPGSNVTAGNRIVVVVGVWNNGAIANDVTDSAGNTYTKVADQVASDGTEESVWTAPVTAGGGTKPTVTAMADSSADIGIAVLEYSGLSTASGTASVDRTATANGTTGSAGTVSSGATAGVTAGNELAVGAYVDSGFGDTLNYGSGWNGRVNESPASDIEVAAEDQTASLGSTPNAQVGTGAGTTWLMATVVFRSASYTTQTGYDDAGQVVSQTYPDGQTVSSQYASPGWLSGLTTAVNGVPSTLVSNVGYSAAAGGGFGEVTSMQLGGAYTYSASYDLLDRATDLKTTKTSGGTVMFEQQRTFDAVGNVTTAQTTMPGGTDNQSFCYDEQDRLTWASAATATPPCGGSNTAGTLTSAQYTQTFGYDVLGRLTSGPLGSYTYASSAHVHAATAIGGQWTAAYDAAGNMTCRAPSSSATCAGTQTGARLGYDNEGELQNWQNAPSSPSTTTQFLYDGQGQRVEQSVIQSGTTTNTVYVGDVEEVATTGATTTTTDYYAMGGRRIGLSVNGTISYLASDALGSTTVTLSGSGSATAAQLFAPYGAVRYSSGTTPTPYGFTGQRSDATSGLDYYGSRYYDPLAGQFTSGDSLVPSGGFDLWGLSRLAYVAGNPVGRTDSTGHIMECECGAGGGLDPMGTPDPGSGSGGIEVPCGCGGTPAYIPPPPPPVYAAPPPRIYQPPPGKSAPPTLPPVKFTSATCGQVGGLNVGSCAPTSGNLNPRPDYTFCVGLGICEAWDAQAISLSGFFFSNGGGDPENTLDRGTGSSSDTAAAGSGKAVVLGEGMEDIRAVARANGFKWYQAWSKFFRPENFDLGGALARNERWIRSKIADGYDFYTIGIDPTRATRSAFYQRELEILEEYGIVPKPLERPLR